MSDSNHLINYVAVGTNIILGNIGMSGLRLDAGAVNLYHRDAGLALKNSKPDEARFSIVIPIFDHLANVYKLLGWYHAIHQATDLLEGTMQNQGSSRVSNLKRNLQVSPDGVQKFTIRQAFPCAFRFEPLSMGKSGFLTIEFAYESIEIAEKDHVTQSSLQVYKKNPPERVIRYALKIANRARQSDITLRALSAFGSKVGVETILKKDTDANQEEKDAGAGQWINVKDAQYTCSPIRIELQADTDSNHISDFLDIYRRGNTTLAESLIHCTLALTYDDGKKPNHENSLILELSQTFLSSIEAMNVKSEEGGARYVVELHPRTVAVKNASCGFGIEEVAKKNFTLESAKRLIKAIPKSRGIFSANDMPAKNIPAKLMMKNLNEDTHLEIYEPHLCLSPSFPGGNTGVAMTPIHSERSTQDKIVAIKDAHIRDLTAASFHRSPDKDADGHSKTQFCFYVYPSASLPIDEDIGHLGIRMDNLLFYLVYGDTALLDGQKISVKVDERTKLSKAWNEKSLFDLTRFYITFKTPGFEETVMIPESVGYVIDRFDKRGRPARYQVMITGLITRRN